jgi:hypothetical protein
MYERRAIKQAIAQDLPGLIIPVDAIVFGAQVMRLSSSLPRSLTRAPLRRGSDAEANDGLPPKAAAPR